VQHEQQVDRPDEVGVDLVVGSAGTPNVIRRKFSTRFSELSG
jgi:hypothetical protein